MLRIDMKLKMEVGKHNVGWNSREIYGHYIDLIHSNFLYIRLGCAIQFHKSLVHFGMCTPNSIMTACHMFMGFNGYSPHVVCVLIMI